MNKVAIKNVRENNKEEEESICKKIKTFPRAHRFHHRKGFESFLQQQASKQAIINSNKVGFHKKLPIRITLKISYITAKLSLAVVAAAKQQKNCHNLFKQNILCCA